jgi:acetyl esterase/lipase
VLSTLAILPGFNSAHAGKFITDGEEIEYSMETYVYKRVGSLEIKADVYRPSDDKTRPAIMFIHGGALISGSRDSPIWVKSFGRYLKAGYAVVSIDYRLAPETKLAGIIEDVEDAYLWMRGEGPELFNIDPNNIAVMGGSAGGYLTLTAGFRLKPSPKALVSFYGYGDVTGDWYSMPTPFYLEKPHVLKETAFEFVQGKPIANTDSLTKSEQQGRGRFYLYCRQQGLWPNEVAGHDPAKEHDWFSDYEARKNVTRNYPPTMLLHGEKDTDVPFEQSVLMAEELERNNVEYEFISQPHWVHGFDFLDNPEVQEELMKDMGPDERKEYKNNLPKPNDPAIKDAHERVLKFLEKHLPQ